MSLLISSLKKSIEFLNIIFDTIPTGIMIVDQNAKIQSFNKGLSNIFQKTDENLINQLCGNGIGCAYEVESNLDCGCTENCENCIIRIGIFKAIKEKKETLNAILKRNFYINNNKIKKYLRLTIKPIIIDNFNYAILFFEDFTEFYEIAEKRNELLGIAAHDIRNPLTIIKMYTDFIKTHTENHNQKILNAFNVIDESINYMIELLNDILNYSSFEKFEIKLQYLKFDYISFVKSIVTMQQMIASEKNIKLIFESELESCKFLFDNNKITQVINNLISNSIKYSYENSIVKIRIYKINENNIQFIKTEIIDNGPGIELNEQEKLFKPFSRANVKPTKNESSTGLGLAIAKKIVDAHKGKIGVISSPSNGSNFWFTLPILE